MSPGNDRFQMRKPTDQHQKMADSFFGEYSGKFITDQNQEQFLIWLQGCNVLMAGRAIDKAIAAYPKNIPSIPTLREFYSVEKNNQAVQQDFDKQNEQDAKWTREQKDRSIFLKHWAFVKDACYKVPKGAEKGKKQIAIDEFMLGKLKGLLIEYPGDYETIQCIEQYQIKVDQYHRRIN